MDPSPAPLHSSVVETTVLLCKPSSEDHHRALLQRVADANFRVEAKVFRMTAAVAAVVAATFPSVRRRCPAGAPPPPGSAAAELLAAHVSHLSRDGRCMAVALSAANAVNRLQAMVGPEDPAVARRTAPGSLSGVYGGEDVVHNAVHAAANLTDAALIIRAVFGPDSAATAKGASSIAAVAAAAAAAAGGGASAGDVGTAAAPSAAAVPRLDWFSTPLPVAGPSPVTLAALLQLRCEGEGCPLRGGGRLSLAPPHSHGTPDSAASSSSTPHTGAAAATTDDGLTGEWATAVQLQQRAEEARAMMQRHEMLRLRETDIFLREAALARANAGGQTT